MKQRAGLHRYRRAIERTIGMEFPLGELTTPSVEVLMERKRRLIVLHLPSAPLEVREGIEAAMAGERLTPAQGLALYKHAYPPLLSLAASYTRLRLNGLSTYYNRNGHIEPTNLCRYQCSFCSFRKERGHPEAWELTLEQIASKARKLQKEGNTEVHITGGVHPEWTFRHVVQLLQTVRQAAPRLHIKAFSAVELVPLVRDANLSLDVALAQLQAAGLDSIPGGGAEIFAEEVRQQICPEKCTAQQWLEVHRQAHRLGMRSNATMLFGHIEGYADRVDHLERLRRLQDETGGFNCFIPLKFRAAGNRLGVRGEVTTLEVLRNYAVCRLYLDNIQHLKGYWPMLGKRNIPLALAYGVDDLDGTIGDSTRIYSMAGAEDQQPTATVSELRQIVLDAGYTPLERDSLYQAV